MTGEAVGNVQETTARMVEQDGQFYKRWEDDWAAHIFRAHNEDADAWADKGAGGPEDEWEDDVELVWSDVTMICGFWAGSCRAIRCGAGMWVTVFTHVFGWHTVHKKCGPVPGGNSLAAEIFGCSMLIESMKKWADTCAC